MRAEALDEAWLAAIRTMIEERVADVLPMDGFLDAFQ